MIEGNSGKGRKRRRVALLMDAIEEDDYQSAMLRGPGSLRSRTTWSSGVWRAASSVTARRDPRCARNFVFDLLSPRDFDGILALSGSLGNLLGVSAFELWLKRSSEVPTVSVGVELSICPNVVAEVVQG